MEHFQFLFGGLQGNSTLVPWMWASVILAVIAATLLVVPKTRRKEATLILACLAVFGSIWIDKGLGMIVAGFTPSPLTVVTRYWPTLPEFLITLGVYAVGLLVITGLYKVALAVRNEL